jgi:RNA polymerase sigma-70 factor (ECF subfamily)
MATRHEEKIAVLPSAFGLHYQGRLLGLAETSSCNVMRGTPHHIAPESVDTLVQAMVISMPAAEGDILEAVYRELRRIAGTLLRGADAQQTLQPTALVHEAYLKIARNHDEPWGGESHFIAVAVRAMRQIVIDRARARNTAKRGGGAKRESLSGVLQVDAETPDVLDVHVHLERLAEIDARRAAVVELRFFGGLSIAEVARVFGVSERTVELDWRAARSWLRQSLAASNKSKLIEGQDP